MNYRERKSLCPYGMWTCAAGRQVLFNRSYWRILERHKRVVRLADPSEWVPWVKQEYFFDDWSAPWRTQSPAARWTWARVNAVLVEWGFHRCRECRERQTRRRRRRYAQYRSHSNVPPAEQSVGARRARTPRRRDLP